MLAHFVRVGPQRQLQPHFIGNNVVFGPPMNRTHGHDGGLCRIRFTANNSLEREDCLRCQHHWIFCLVRPGSMAAHAPNGDVHGIHVRQRVPFSDPNRS